MRTLHALCTVLVLLAGTATATAQDSAAVAQSLERTAPAAQVVEAPRSPWVVTGRAAALERVQGVLTRASSLDEEVARVAAEAAGDLDHPWLAFLGAVLLCLACFNLVL